ALGWMSGDYALTVGLAPSFTDAANLTDLPTSLPVDFGLIISATDETAAKTTFDGLTRSLAALTTDSVTITQETLHRDAPVLVFNVPASEDMSYAVEIVAALGNGVFAIGTRRTVTAALNPQNGGLSADPTYTEATSHTLADANTMLYLSGNGLQPIARLMTAV